MSYQGIIVDHRRGQQPGQNKVEIRGLPTCVDPHSVRVSGLVDARLLDVVCTIANNTLARDPVRESLRALRAAKTRVEDEKRIREREARLLRSYATTLDGKHVNPVQMAAFLEGFVEQNRRNLDAVSLDRSPDDQCPYWRVTADRAIFRLQC